MTSPLFIPPVSATSSFILFLLINFLARSSFALNNHAKVNHKGIENMQSSSSTPTTPTSKSKSIHEYLQLSFGTERYSSFMEIANFNNPDDEMNAVDVEESITIGCSSYANGRDAAIKYSTPNHYEILISPYFISFDDDAMCFIIYSDGYPNRQSFPEFDQILPYSSPMKIDGIYEQILTLWDPTASARTTPISHSKLFEYLETLLTILPSDTKQDDDEIEQDAPAAPPLHYEIYVSTFQFQYRPILMGGGNASDSILQTQSRNIFDSVKNMLYANEMGPSPSHGYSETAWKKWHNHHQNLRRLKEEDTSTDPCGYEMIDYSLHDNNIVIPMGSLVALRNATLRSTCLANVLFQFSINPLIALIELREGVHTMNFRSRGIQESAKVGSSQQTSPYTAAGLTGAGVVVGVADTGLDENSCYFDDSSGRVQRSLTTSPVADMNRRKVVQYSRLSVADSSDVTQGHGTHVCGTVAGNNRQDVYGESGYYNGVAFGTRLAFLDIADSRNVLYGPSVADEYPVLARGGATIFTNSWGAPFDGNGYYSGYNIDQYLYNNMDIAVFFAGGNSGLPSSGLGTIGTITREASAKNVIGVGASETTLSSASIDSVAWFSSVGPTYDGRIKPDILAPGYSIQSVLSATAGSNAYTCGTTVKAGTSMSSPGAAGVAALVRQYFSDSRFWAKLCESGDPTCRAFVPSGVLIKALMIHSGQSMVDYNGGSKGKFGLSSGTPDHFQGFGRVQLTNVLPITGISTFLLFVRDLVPMGEYSSKARTFKVTGNSRPIKATLVWYDPPAAASTTSKALINDLDMIITSPSQKIYYANRLSSYDRKNTVEQIIIPSPVNGIWTLTILSNALPYGQQQKFSVSLTCIGQTIYSTTSSVRNNSQSEGTGIGGDSFDDWNLSNSYEPLQDSVEENTAETQEVEEPEDEAEDLVLEVEDTPLMTVLWNHLLRFIHLF